MFTGLVEGIGTIRAVTPATIEVRLSIELPPSLADDGQVCDGAADDGTSLGDSVAINGCCLTVVSRDGNVRDVQAGAETLAKTNLGRLTVGDAVNLERAMPVGGRFGGHVVQGHVDGVATVRSIESHGDWIDMAFDLPGELARQLVPKGSVAVDGVSLTVVDVTDAGFSVALIPHTLAETTLAQRKPGDVVNIETDILGKYVQKMLGRSVKMEA